jgi:hypothetical protein
VKERKEVKEEEEVEEKSGRVAAFFDLDGTLVALPSLERRFFRMLRYRRAIAAKNYWRWLAEAVRLAPRSPCDVARKQGVLARSRGGPMWRGRAEACHRIF